jgi:hypothetical protein
MAAGEKHHIIFTRETQSSQKATKTLRASRWLIPYIEHDPHKELHRAVATVPVLDHFMAERVLANFSPVRNDYLATMDELMFCIEDAMQHPRVKVIERGIGELAIAAIDLQKPFIKEGLIM